MAELESHPPGTFCWVELTTTDGPDARRFYGDVFGWTGDDVPVGPDSVYTMLRKNDRDVGALYEMDAKQRARGVPPAWLSYVSVAEADGTAGRVAELGGQVVAPPFDVFTAGRMAVLQDPAGAKLAIWEPRDHAGVGLKSVHGAPCWNELVTPDPDGMRAFYSGLFGWESLTKPIGGTPYTSWMLGGTPVGGMLRVREEWGDVPAHWAVYFAVDDCDDRARAAEAGGGRVCVPPTDIPEVGRFAALTDPQGAAFSIIHLEERA
ncbi:MAG: VOC family protein [Gemmatimonadota bacterium]